MFHVYIPLSVVLLILLVGITKSETLYVSKFDNFTINCPFRSKNANVVWNGPPNMTPYSSNGYVNSKVKGIDIFEDFENGETSLTIYGFHESNEGAYQCATVSEGKPVKKDFTVILQNNVSKSEIFYVTKSSNVTIICPFKSAKAFLQWNGPPNFTSYSNKNAVNPAVKDVEIIGERANGEYNLIVYGFEESNQGVYQCITVNDGKPVMYAVNVMLQINKLSPDKINCTSIISLTDSFTTTDQMQNGNHQRNNSGITRSEIILCCALVCILFVTMISYVRNRHYRTRNINIIGQQNDNTSTDQRASETENIHLYSTADDYSVQMFPVVTNGSIHGDDNDLESISSIPSSMDFDIEEDYIHPYDTPVYSFQDNKHDYEKLDHSGEYFTAISHDRNDDKKSIISTDNICSSITSGFVPIGHSNIVKSSSSKENTICKKYTKDQQGDLTDIHINGTNANTKNINQSLICGATENKHHVFDDISLD